MGGCLLDSYLCAAIHPTKMNRGVIGPPRPPGKETKHQRAVLSFKESRQQLMILPRHQKVYHKISNLLPHECPAVPVNYVSSFS